MITEKDLQEAIAECQGQRNPNANTCIKLAAFYTIKNELYGKSEQLTKDQVLSLIGDNGFVNRSGYSYAPPPEEVETTINYYSDTEFGRLINGKNANEVWAVIDEMINKVIQHISPRLYDAVLRKIRK